MALEVLLIQIRENANIKGIIIDETEIKLSTYADDGSFFVIDVQSLQLIFFMCNQFREFSSLKLNLEKSEACWIGKAEGREDKPIDCNWINFCNDKIRILGVNNSYDTDLENIYNFFSVISKIKNCLKCWGGRGLTIAGRIQIFKTLAISKILYMSTMRTPPTQFLELLNSIQKDFIWNNSRAKIKHCSIIADYKEGGYKDIDISSKLLAMKISWIKRFLDDNFHPWKILPTRLLAPLGGSSIFHYNLQLEDRGSNIVKTFPTFYQELIELWCKISYQKPSDITQIYNRSLWYNSFIVRQGKPIFNLSFINKGILKVRDILNDAGNFFSWHLGKSKYNLDNRDFISWIGLIESIPQMWKREIKLFSLHSAESCSPCSLSREHFVPDLTVKGTYKTLIRPVVQQPTAQRSIERILQMNDMDWATVYLLPQKTTIESRMRIFQYKILNNILYLNNWLYKFSYVESPMCSLCNSETETMTRLFCHCSKTDQMWNSLTSWCKGCLTLPVLEPSTAILGFFDIRDEKSKLINHILILFKFFLHANRNIKHAVNFHALKLFISSVQKIEQKIAFNGNKLDQHLSKWQPIAHLVD